ncbi:hypothetical protein JXA88_12235 [Candidatus Fermentibacteria bacterium]|nr:hypothetical protein [Candidatus Fermentibacteria bacterium]
MSKGSRIGLSLLLVALACRASDPKASEIGSVVQTPVLEWPRPDTLLSVTRTGSLRLVEGCSIPGSGQLAADSLGVLISTSNRLLAMDWECRETWSSPVSSNAGMPTGLCSVASLNDSALLLAEDMQGLRTLCRRTGRALSEGHFLGDLGGMYRPEIVPYLSAPCGVHVGRGLIVASQHAFTCHQCGACVVLYDESFHEVLVLGTKKREDGAAFSAVTSSGEASFFIATKDNDAIHELRPDGTMVRSLTCGHTRRRPAMAPAVCGGEKAFPKVFPIVVSLVFADPDTLWVLYGGGAFESDLSELWQVRLSSLEASVLQLPFLAEDAAVYGSALAVVDVTSEMDAHGRYVVDPEKYRVHIGRWEVSE